MVHDSTAPVGAWQRKRERRSAEIVAHALGIVAQGGLGALTVARLAEAMGTSVGALYRYFDGKDALIAAVQQAGLDAFVDFQDARLAAAPRDALARVVVAAGAWTAFAAADPPLHALLDEALSAPDPVLAEPAARKVAEAVSRALKPLESALNEAVRSGQLAPGDAALRARALWAAMHGVGHFKKRDRLEPLSLASARVENELIDALLRGWGATQPSAQQGGGSRSAGGVLG
jgi:AcrR family transcriptional regulator